jgi:hypothetical protein
MKTTLSTLFGLFLLAAPAAVRAQFIYTTNADGLTLTITGYSGPVGPVIIPTNINGLTVVNIGNSAFSGTNQLGVVGGFPNNVPTSVVIPNTVTNIGHDAFYNCASLTNATIANGVTSIGEEAFAYTSLTSLTIPGSVTNIGYGAFYICASLTNATIANGVISIGDYAFYFCTSLAGVTIPASVTNIGINLFSDCTSLPAIMVDAQNAFYSSVNGVLFDKDQATLIEYPGGKAGNYAIPGSVTSIGSYAFFDCPRLTTLAIPASVTNIGDYLFGFCTNLRRIYFEGNAPAVGIDSYWPENVARIYYLPGTTGWVAFSASTGQPAVLWNPLIQAGGASFGVRSNQFGFNITGTTNIPIVVEACANLASPVWTPLATLALTDGLIYFSDPQWTNYPGRFYRISSP